MSEKAYYERYWKKEFRSYGCGAMELPPEWEEDNLRRILAFYDGALKGQVLDAGCGDGFFASQLIQQKDVHEVIGIDISETAIESAKAKYPEILFQQGALNNIPMKDNCFDAVTMVEVIEHLVDIEGTLGEIFRILRPGGLLLITTTDFNWLKQVLIAMFCFEQYFYPTNPHIRFFTKSTLAKILSIHGLNVVKYGWNGSYFGIMPKGQMVLAQKEGSY